MVRPNVELLGTSRVFLKSRQTKTVSFFVDFSQLAYLDETMQWIVDSADIQLLIGHSVKDIRLSGTVNVNQHILVDESTRSFFAKTDIFPAITK